MTAAFYEKVKEIKSYLEANSNLFGKPILLAMKRVPRTMEINRHLCFTEQFRATMQIFTAFELMTAVEFEEHIIKKFATDHDSETERWILVTEDPNGNLLDTVNQRLMVSTKGGWRKFLKGTSGDKQCSINGNASYDGYKSYDEEYVTGDQHRNNAKKKTLIKGSKKAFPTFRILAHLAPNPLFPTMPTSLQKFHNGPFDKCGTACHLLGTKDHNNVEQLCKWCSIVGCSLF